MKISRKTGRWGRNKVTRKQVRRPGDILRSLAIIDHRATRTHDHTHQPIAIYIYILLYSTRTSAWHLCLLSRSLPSLSIILFFFSPCSFSAFLSDVYLTWAQNCTHSPRHRRTPSFSLSKTMCLMSVLFPFLFVSLSLFLFLFFINLFLFFFFFFKDCSDQQQLSLAEPENKPSKQCLFIFSRVLFSVKENKPTGNSLRA